MNEKTDKVFTFGYEGQAIAEFIARLHHYKVQLVIDVRKLPLSRKPGFSKRSFAQALDDANITYRHSPIMGCPKPIRDRYKLDSDWNAYSVAFADYLKAQPSTISDLAEIVKQTRSCLVCFEADFNRCHRSLVVSAIAKVGRLSVEHLTTKTVIADSTRKLAA